MKTIGLLALAFGVFVAMTPARVQNWEKLGQKVVNMKGDHDELLVTTMEGVFTAVKFKVLKAPIHVVNVRIVFGNGEDLNFPVNRKFAAGEESAVLDLPGNKRIIKKIVFNYKSVPAGKGRAVVLAFGRH
jgi:hypothetical protein